MLNTMNRWKGKRFEQLPDDIREQITYKYLQLGCFDRWQIERLRKGPMGAIHKFIPELSKIDLVRFAKELSHSTNSYKPRDFYTLFTRSEAFRDYIYTYVPRNDIDARIDGTSFTMIMCGTPRTSYESHYVEVWLKQNDKKIIDYSHEFSEIIYAVGNVLAQILPCDKRGEPSNKRRRIEF